MKSTQGKVKCCMTIVTLKDVKIAPVTILHSIIGPCASSKGFSRKKTENYSRLFNSRFRHTDDVLLPSNSRFGDYLHHIYPHEHEVKYTTDTQMSASYLDLHLEIDSR